MASTDFPRTKTGRPALGKGKKLLFSLLVLGAFTLAGALGAELLIRVIGETDPDGNFQFRGRVLGTERPHLHRLSKLIQRMEDSGESSVMMASAELGWRWRPGSSSEDGLHCFDTRGARVSCLAKAALPGGATSAGPARHIALYGDSFTQCSDVAFEDSWGHLLQESLSRSGERVAVTNFGSSGYGMGQALLLYREHQATEDADIVVFGFQAENVFRNVNMLRPMYFLGSGIPFSKPRLSLVANGLETLNVPTISAREVLDVLRAPEFWPLISHEYFYIPQERSPPAWENSKLLCLVSDRLQLRSPRRQQREACYQPGAEAFELTLAIVRAFRSDVEARGGRFLLVHLPIEAHLRELRAGRPLPQAALLEVLSREMEIVDPTPELLELSSRMSLSEMFIPHYAPECNSLVAVALARALP